MDLDQPSLQDPQSSSSTSSSSSSSASSSFVESSAPTPSSFNPVVGFSGLLPHAPAPQLPLSSSSSSSPSVMPLAPSLFHIPAPQSPVQGVFHPSTTPITSNALLSDHMYWPTTPGTITPTEIVTGTGIPMAMVMATMTTPSGSGLNYLSSNQMLGARSPHTPAAPHSPPAALMRGAEVNKVLQVRDWHSEGEEDDENVRLELLGQSKDAVTCNDPEVLHAAQDMAQRLKAIKTDEARAFVLQSILSSCRVRQLQFVSTLIRPFLQRDFISHLPTEMSVEILSHLDPLSLCRAASVSKKWRSLVNDDKIWRGLAERFHFDYPRDWHQHAGFSWKEFFKSKYRVHLNWVRGGNSRIYHLPGHANGVVTCLQFDERRIISGSDDCTIKIWATQSGQLLRTVSFPFPFSSFIFLLWSAHQ